MAQPDLTIYYRSFADLTPIELYTIMRLRNEVFVVEQKCVYQDADNKDLPSYHLMIWDTEKLVAYARLLPKGLSFEQVSIGRVISSPAYRNRGIGKILVAQAITACRELFGTSEIKIGAQLYLKRFYESFGFVQSGEHYMEDDIEHIPMILV